MRCVVTGARGFVGSHLCEALRSEGWQVCEVSNLSHSRSDCRGPFCYADVRYCSEIEPLVQDVDVVFHLAARINVDHSLVNPQLFLETNTWGTFNMLELSRRHGFRLLLASTSEVYGVAEAESLDESCPLNPQSPYGASKAAADMFALGHYAAFGTRVIIVRCFNITGPGQSWDTQGALIPRVMCGLLRGEAPVIFGDGAQRRDYTDVRDAVRAYVMLSQVDDCYGQVFNVGTGVTRSVSQIVDQISQLLGSVIHPHRAPPRPGEVRSLCCDSRKIRRVVGWVPQIPFEQTLRDMWEYYSGILNSEIIPTSR